MRRLDQIVGARHGSSGPSIDGGWGTPRAKDSGSAVPLISVLTIAGTGRPYLTKALRSLVSQGVTDWEVIVLDACYDPADSAKVQAQVREVPDERIRLVRYDQDDVTFPPFASRKWNVARRHARGDLIAFLDDDDEKDAGWFSAMTAPLLAEPSLGATVCDGVCIDKDGIRGGVVFFGSASLDRTSLLRAGFVTTGQILVRRSVLDEIGGFDDQLGCSEDYDFCLRLSSYPWRRVEGCRSLKRDGVANACYHQGVNNHTQVALRRTLVRHGVLDESCSRCGGLAEPLPDDVAAGGWHWRIQFSQERSVWELLCGLPPRHCA